MQWLKRIRQSRGFGVHSPFAFRLITEVLGEKLPYYDFDTLKSRDERLLYRLLCRFNPKAVYASGRAADVVARCGYSITDDAGTADFVVADAAVDRDTLQRCVDSEKIIYIGSDNRDIYNSLKPMLDTKGRGMTFTDAHGRAVVATTKKLPRQDFLF